MNITKKIAYTFILSLLLTACGSSKSEDANATTPTPTTETPTQTTTTECNIYEGTPKTDNRITLKVVCTDAEVTIDSAKVTVNGTTKNVDYEGSAIIDYLSFGGLDADTSYEAKLEVLVGGETLVSTVSVKTKTASPEPATPLEATTITHNGTTYGFVTSPHTGKVWLDRNLGAARVCESFNDTACYGDYYQWGRNFDGHEDSGSGTTSTQATDVNSAGSDFITSNNVNSYDWAKTADSSGSIRQSNWSKTDGSSVCPVGFRVPNITELRAETLDNGVTNRDTAYTNFLKLPSAGFRSNFVGSMHGVGSWGNVWTSSNGGSRSHGVGFNSYDADWGSDYRALGFSVRCLRD